MVYGSVAEWFKALVLKTSVRQRTVSSNLTASANPLNSTLKMRFGPLVVHLKANDGNKWQIGCYGQLLRTKGWRIRYLLHQKPN